jgi:hypothetical protein
MPLPTKRLVIGPSPQTIAPRRVKISLDPLAGSNVCSRVIRVGLDDARRFADFDPVILPFDLDDVACVRRESAQNEQPETVMAVADVLLDQVGP